ncbi:hypothetical protein VPNG_00135 [Cytospora leucostoma]|uniref:Uncharacterized protein n=1 Tax=Cytospora leucostoma TaxID=1230097 RepID=A0A423XNW6_9PEZI|nr:hypothetical protein VPNG_00135 [Cytospora leucostoma]
MSPTQMLLPIRGRPEKGHTEMTTNKKQRGDKKKIQEEWDQYFGTNDNDLASWQRLGRDLGIPEAKLTSKTQIRKALKGIWVNIHDFLYRAKNKPQDVEFFESERQLSDYTVRTKKIFPRKNISPGSPLRELLAHILYPRGGKKSKR